MEEDDKCDHSPITEILQKSAKLSEAARLEGNSILKEKSQHSRKEHRKILYFYSKSIAFAPNESEELALGYGNRSFLLNHLKRYQSSITDIHRALMITKSDTLRSKLVIRKVACMKAMNKRNFLPLINEARKMIEVIHDEKMKSQLKVSLNMAINQEGDLNNLESEIIDLPKIDSDRELPATSTSIRMEHSKDLGRHYRATKNILTGEMLIIEQGYSAVPTEEHLYIVCSFCLNFAWTGIPCDKCPCVIYCSEQCKEAAWKLYHDLECPILILSFKEISPAINIRLALRVLMKGLKEDPTESFDYLLREFLTANNSSKMRLKGFKKNILNSESIRAIFSLTNSFKSLRHNDSHHTLLEKLSHILQDRFKELSSIEFYESLQNFDIYNLKDFLLYIACLVSVNSFPYTVHHCSCDDFSTAAKIFQHKMECIVELGRIIGVCQSLVNHSCIPNAAKVLRDGKIILYALRPITKNDQICCSYAPIYMDPLIKRKEFMTRYHTVICHCLACKEQWDLSSLAQEIKYSQAELHFGESLFSELNQLVHVIIYKKEMLVKRKMQRIILELKCKINTIYKSNSLFDASTIMSFLPDALIIIYNEYYGGDAYMLEDSKNNS